MSDTGTKKAGFQLLRPRLGCDASICRRPKKHLFSNFHPKPKPTTYRKHQNYLLLHRRRRQHAVIVLLLPLFFLHVIVQQQHCHHGGDLLPRCCNGQRRRGESCRRTSMLQMILEKHIYSRDDLRELLNCFLQLNLPYHHSIIDRAFSQIWNRVFSSSTAKSLAAAGAGGSGLMSKPLLMPPYQDDWGLDNCYRRIGKGIREIDGIIDDEEDEDIGRVTTKRCRKL
ncbi:unnamed protein product [Linum trigynum]|uniref:Transcription repressor n=1 Tax=Linum trigynum TaxID=586398 RepID=A0AAV2EX11_9ROSI